MKKFFYLFPFLSFSVSGNSMLPKFIPGQKVLVQKLWFFSKLQKGDVIVLKDPRNGKMILKRISKIKCHPERSEGSNSISNLIRNKILRFTQNDNEVDYYVLGDNLKESTDSRHFGFIKSKDIIGKVIFSERV